MLFHNKNLLKQTTKVVIGILLIIFLISRIELQQLFKCIKSSNHLYIFVAFIVFGFSILFQGLRLNIFINKYGFNLITAINISFISVFFNNLSPGTIVGDGYKIVVFKQKIENWSTPFALVLLERLVGLFAILLIGAIYFLFSHTRLINIFHSLEIKPQFNSMIFVAAAGIFMVISISFLFKTKLKKFVLNFVGFIDDIKQIIFELFVYKSLLLICLSIMSHLFIALTIYILVRSFGNNFFFIDSIFVIFLIIITSYIPISIGSLGVREGVILLSLTFFSISQPTAVAVALVARIITYIYAIVGGVSFLFFRTRHSQPKHL